jgi:hypothetical protein
MKFYTPKTDGEDQREQLLGATTMTEGDNGMTDDGRRGVDLSAAQTSPYLHWDSELMTLGPDSPPLRRTDEPVASTDAVLSENKITECVGINSQPYIRTHNLF